MKTFTLLIIIFLSFCGFAQEGKETQVDSMLVNIDKSTFTSGILYERVMGLAQLGTFNDTIRPAHFTYFKQALLELYRASNKEKFMQNKVLEPFYTPSRLQNQVDIGIINASFHQVNYDPENENNGALRIGPDDKFERINSNPPFLPKHVFIAAPLKLNVKGEDVVYHFNKNLLLENTEKKNIKTLTANFDTGQTFTIINNGVILQEKVGITYAESGIKALNFTATFEDGSRLTTIGALNFKLLKSSTPPTGIKNDSVFATLPFKGYNPNDPTLPGRLDYRIFYHTVNNVPVATLLKPIVIIDGFDPGDKRQIQDSDPHPDQTDAEHRSIEDMMTYFDDQGDIQPIIDTLRTIGYDVVIVNHPKYKVNGVEIDGGAEHGRADFAVRFGIYGKERHPAQHPSVGKCGQSSFGGKYSGGCTNIIKYVERLCR